MRRAASDFRLASHEAFEERYQELLDQKAQVAKQYSAQLATLRKRVVQLEQTRQSERMENETEQKRLRDRVTALTMMVEKSSTKKLKAEAEANLQKSSHEQVICDSYYMPSNM